jgi:hypothetical protein
MMGMEIPFALHKYRSSMMSSQPLLLNRWSKASLAWAMRMCRAILAFSLLVVFVARPTFADPPPPLVPADTSSMRDVVLTPGPWSYMPSPTQVKLSGNPMVPPTTQVDRYPGPGGKDFLVPCGNASLAFQYVSGSVRGDKGQIDQLFLQIFDLRSGGAGHLMHIPDTFSVKAISPDGKVAILSAEARFAPNASEVDLADIKDQKLQLRTAFIPYAGEEKGNRYVYWARLLDDEHLLTLNDGRGADEKLVLWEITSNSVSALWSLKLTHHYGGDPVLSPDSKYLLLSTMAGDFLLEAMTGQVAGSMGDSTASSWFVNSGLRFSFRPDGKMLARSTDSRVRVFSLDNPPRQVADISMPPKMKASEVTWAGNDFLLINRSYLVDLKSAMIVWKYTGLGSEGGRGGELLAIGDKVVFISIDDSKFLMSAYELPDDFAKATIAKLDLNHVMVIKPGEKVTLSIDIPDQELADHVRSHFETELKKNQMQLADGQEIKLLVTMGVFRNEKVGYRDVFRRTRVADASVDVQQMSVGYQVGDNFVWQTTLYAGAPLLVNIRPGQTLNSAIAQKQAGTWGQIDDLELPKYVPAYREDPGFGQTALDEPAR